jgi:hypothetical protein
MIIGSTRAKTKVMRHRNHTLSVWSSRGQGLSFGWDDYKITACRFSNFIANNVTATAKFSSVQKTGRGRNVQIAVQRSCQRSFLYLLPEQPALLTPPHALVFPVPVVCAVQAARIRIKVQPMLRPLLASCHFSSLHPGQVFHCIIRFVQFELG